MQKVQNFACRIITGKRTFDHITPVLRELRWLPVTSFLKYTLGVLAFKCVKGLAPSYLCCCGASVASEQQHKQDLRGTYTRVS